MSKLTKEIEKAERNMAKARLALDAVENALAALKALDVPPGGGLTEDAPTGKGRKKAAK